MSNFYFKTIQPEGNALNFTIKDIDKEQAEKLKKRFESEGIKVIEMDDENKYMKVGLN